MFVVQSLGGQHVTLREKDLTIADLHNKLKKSSAARSEADKKLVKLPADLELEGGPDPEVGKESRRVASPTASREEPFDQPEPIEPADSPSYPSKDGILVESAPRGSISEVNP